MRCYACNKILTPFESTRKFASGEFVDMCTKCLGTIQDDIEIDEQSGVEGDDDDAIQDS